MKTVSNGRCEWPKFICRLWLHKRDWKKLCVWQNNDAGTSLGAFCAVWTILLVRLNDHWTVLNTMTNQLNTGSSVNIQLNFVHSVTLKGLRSVNVQLLNGLRSVLNGLTEWTIFSWIFTECEKFCWIVTETFLNGGCSVDDYLNKQCSASPQNI